MKPALARIAQNIAAYGHHVYLISGGPSPRFAYTIGLTDACGAELVLAGCALYSAREVHRVVNDVAARVRAGAPLDGAMDLGAAGSISLRPAATEWTRALLLGALDYYAGRDVRAYQIVPDALHATLDVPNLEAPPRPGSEPSWRWTFEAWPYAVPRASIAATHTAVVRGARVTRVARWEDDTWELFAGDGEVAREDLCVVPLGVLVGVDPSLAAAVDLAIGEGLERDDAYAPWRPWGT